MTVLKDRPDIREVPKLERPPRPWFGWIVSLVVLVIAGGIWLIARDGTDDESPVAVPAEVSGELDSFERNEFARFERLDPAGLVITAAPGGADGQDLAEAARIRALRGRRAGSFQAPRTGGVNTEFRTTKATPKPESPLVWILVWILVLTRPARSLPSRRCRRGVGRS